MILGFTPQTFATILVAATAGALYALFGLAVGAF